MKANSILPLLLTTAFILPGCQKSEEENYRDLIKEKFHGRYEIVSARSDRAVDVNLDHVPDADLLLEIQDLENAYLELKIKRRESASDERELLFSQLWPNQSLSKTTIDEVITEYDPAIVVNYLMQPTVGRCGFSNDFEEILFLNEDKTDEEFPQPEAVHVKENGDIIVIMKKRLYTTSGWEDVEIEVLYKRYTTIT